MRLFMDTESYNVLDMAEVSEVNLSKFVLYHPYYLNLFCSIHKYLSKENDFEILVRSRA